MSVLERIKEHSLTARKAKDTFKATLLTTLYSEAVNVGKNNGNRLTTDAETVAVVKKFVNGVNETISAMKGVAETDDRYANAVQEKTILEQYIPVQLTELELQKIVGTMAQALPDRGPKQMGVLMKQLKEKYDGQYDGALASKVIKAILA